VISRDYIVGIVRELLAGLVVQTRRGTTSQWAASTRPLKDGEQGWNKTTKQLYVGNGTALYPNYDVVGGSSSGGLSEVNYENLPAGMWLSVAYVPGVGWPARPTDRDDLVVVWTDVTSESTEMPVGALVGLDLFGKVPL
jgi:hypothetical protein